MCWNIEVSLASAVVGWATCAYLYQRKRSPRDLWYARYLLTFTFTQLVDIALWTLHDQTGGLKACPNLKEQFTMAPIDEQRTQFYISKYVVPLVTFSQHAMQLTYPSDIMKNYRTLYTLLHGLPLVGMCFMFACSDILVAKWPHAHDTIRWGGHTAETYEVLIISGLVAFDFWLLTPAKEAIVAWVHIFTLACVMSFLYTTEGTLALGSKWCTYCLIYSAVYIAEPLWGPPAEKIKSKQI